MLDELVSIQRVLIFVGLSALVALDLGHGGVLIGVMDIQIGPLLAFCQTGIAQSAHIMIPHQFVIIQDSSIIAIYYSITIINFTYNNTYRGIK